MAVLADQVKVTRLPVGMLEAETAFAEIDLTRNAGIHHPLEGAIHGCPADALILATDDVDQIVGTEVSLLAEKHIHDLLAFAGALAALRLQSAEIGKGRRHGGRPRSLHAEGRSAAAGRCGVRVLDRETTAGHRIDEVDFSALEVADAHRVHEQPDAVRLEHLIRISAAFLDHEAVLKP